MVPATIDAAQKKIKSKKEHGRGFERAVEVISTCCELNGII